MDKAIISFKTYINRRNSILFIFTLVALLMCYQPLRNLLQFDANDRYYSHIVFIPLTSACLIYMSRKALFSRPKYSYTGGIIVLAVGVMLYFLGRSLKENLGLNDYAALTTISALILWTGAFILLYGVNAFRRAVFPFLFLIFTVPIPSLLMAKVVYMLQVGSGWVTYILFELAGIPFTKEGFIFHCQGVDIKISEECSGIRSTLALLMPPILAAYFFLRSNWKRTFLIVAVFPISILKNGFRILVLSLLAIYVDTEYPVLIFLHKYGGIFFYMPAICLLGFLFLFLRKSERKKSAVMPPVKSNQT